MTFRGTQGEVGDTGREDVYLFDLEASAPSAVPITRGFDASYLYVGTDQGKIYFLTTLDAPRGRVVAIDPANPARSLWQTVIPEGEDAIALTEPRVTPSPNTARDKLAIIGGSNGGPLVGACPTQRPDLVGAAVAAVGVMDMLRFDRFGHGTGWTGDYGSPHDPEDSKALIGYSPVHNVRAGTHYPATLAITGDHETGVMPMHSFKFAAALQAGQVGSVPVLL